MLVARQTDIFRGDAGPVGQEGPIGVRARRAPAARPPVMAASWLGLFLTLTILSCFPTPANGQMGGMGGGMPGAGGGAGAPGPPQRAKFRDAIHETDGLTIGREEGDKIVLAVRLVGNRSVSPHLIHQKLQTRKDRFFDYETVLADVHRLIEMGSFDDVTFDIQETPADAAQPGVIVTFKVRERPVITEVIFFGNTRINDRELRGRAGLTKKDPLNPYAIESAQRRLIDYYHEEGFNRVAISVEYGQPDAPEGQRLSSGEVVFRINEGQKERIRTIRMVGNTIVSGSRLKSIIKSRDARYGATLYVGNTADLQKINRDVDILQAYYHNLGFLTASVGRSIEYEENGKFMSVTFDIHEGPRFRIGDIQIVGNQYVTEESLRARHELISGATFSGTKMQLDIGSMIYGYGELGFIYAEVEPKTIIRDEAGVVDLVYQIEEGDRWRIGEIHVNIDGEPHLMKESTILNLMELREGDVIDRRKLESDRRRLGASPLLEADMNIAEPPDIKVVPRQELR